MSDEMPPGWVEEIITPANYEAELCTGKYSPRLKQNEILMIMLQQRGIRMTGAFTLTIDTPYEIIQGPRGLVVRQGPAVANT